MDRVPYDIDTFRCAFDKIRYDIGKFRSNIDDVPYDIDEVRYDNDGFRYDIDKRNIYRYVIYTTAIVDTSFRSVTSKYGNARE